MGGWTGKIPTAVRNLQDEYWPEEKSSLLKEEVFKRNWETGRVSGFCCPLACTHYYSAAREGEKINAEGMHANSVRGFGSNWDITDPLIVLKIHSICSEYGLNVDGVSAAVAWAMECFEEGLLTEKDTGGIKLCFGDGESALQVVEQIAAGVGFGALLEKGVAEAVRITGRGTEKHAVTIMAGIILIWLIRMIWLSSIITLPGLTVMEMNCCRPAGEIICVRSISI